MSVMNPLTRPFFISYRQTVWLGVLLSGLMLEASAVPAASPVDSAIVAPLVKKSQLLVAPELKTTTKPEWHELTVAQQLALKPLMSNWGNISEGHKRKWLAVSQNFGTLPVAEQSRMHERMTEWAALSPLERSQARLNYAGVRELPADERLAKWQAYQALTPEQRQQLAATGGPIKPVGAATAAKPVAPQKLTLIPAPVVKLPGDTSTRHSPKIATAPHQVNRHTLLPQPVQVSVPMPVPQAVPVTESNTTTAN